MGASSSSLRKASSVSPRLSRRMNSSVAKRRSGSLSETRRKFSDETGSMMVFHFSMRFSEYRSRIDSSARPSQMPARQSYRPPTSTKPPVMPSPPQGLHRCAASAASSTRPTRNLGAHRWCMRYGEKLTTLYSSGLGRPGSIVSNFHGSRARYSSRERPGTSPYVMR